MSTLKFKFDGNLDFQRKAIESVVNLFEGQPLAKETYSIALGQATGQGNRSMPTTRKLL